MTAVDKPPPSDDGDIPLKPVIPPVDPEIAREEAKRARPVALASAPAGWRKPFYWIANTSRRVVGWVVSWRNRPGGVSASIAPASWPIADEPAWGRYVAAVILAAGALLYAYVLQSYYAGAHGGVDQNGYLRTAQLIYDEGKIGWRQSDPYEFAGRMCVIVEPYGSPRRDTAMTTAAQIASGVGVDLANPLAGIEQRIEPRGDPAVPFTTYAKYPIGYPLLAAIARWWGGPNAMYVVNPACTLVAFVFAYLMFRQALRRFTSLVGVALLACNPLTLNYANDANSHASTLAFVCIGFWGLFAWMRTHSWWRGFIGGIALGYACTIRYSEFLLVIPVAFAASTSLLANLGTFWMRRHERDSLRFRAIFDWIFPLLGWAIPVGLLAIVCHNNFGGWGRTGYTYCNEDTGFAWRYFLGALGNAGGADMNRQGNWETFLVQLNRTGLFFVWPLAIVGLFGMLGRLPRMALTLILWIFPATLLYMFYYWAPTQETALNYLRFFVSVMPALLLAGLWLAERALDSLENAAGNKWISLTLVTGFAVAVFIVAAWVMFDYDKKFAVDEYENHFFSKSFQLTGWAIWAMWQTNAGWVITGTLAAMLAGVWIFERETARRRAALAVGLGTAAMLACGVNLHNVMPQVEASQANLTHLRQMVDVVREKARPGAVLFAEENLAQQLDVLGAYRLYSTSLFGTGMRGESGSMTFAQSKRVVQSRDEQVEKDGEADPNPYQYERARYYMELFGRPIERRSLIDPSPGESSYNQLVRIFGMPPLPRQEKVTTEWVTISESEVIDAEISRWDRAFSENRKVYYIMRDTARPDRPALIEGRRRGYAVAKVVSWRGPDSVAVPALPAPALDRRGRPGRGGLPGAMPLGANRPLQPAPVWTIYEVSLPAKKPL